MEKLVSYLSEPGYLILDFFAGSNTMLHGVLRSNVGQKVPRRAIAVQMPEPIKPDSEAGNNALALGLKNLADISRERARRVLAGTARQHAAAKVRCFKLAASNTRRWAGVEERTPEAYQMQLDAFADALIPSWKPKDLIWEVALREGYSLNSGVEVLSGSKGGVFHRVSDAEQRKRFTAGFDDVVTVEQVAALGLSREDLFVCRATALDDTVAANLAMQCRLKVV